MGARAVYAIFSGIVITFIAMNLGVGRDSFRCVKNFLNENGYADIFIVKDVLNLLEERVSDQDSSTSTGNQNSKTEASDIVFTAEQLKEYSGASGSKGLYLAILGEVFDVEKGAQHYRPGGGYEFFAGRDATRAYITGDFSENGLSDDVSDLDAASLASLEDWLTFYNWEYERKGYVIGKYYDINGKPTELLLKIKEKMKEAVKNKWTEDKSKDIFPSCNSEWSKEKGSKVWCTKKSGGVERSWIGVPRELHIQGKDPRCVCVKNSGPPSSDPHAKEHPDLGDLNYPGLKEYAGCLPDSESCSVSHP